MLNILTAEGADYIAHCAQPYRPNDIITHMLESLPDNQGDLRPPQRGGSVPDIRIRPESARSLSDPRELAAIGHEAVVKPFIDAASYGLKGATLIRELMRDPQKLLDSQLDRAYVSLNDDLADPSRRYGRVWMEAREVDRRGSEHYFGDGEVTIVFLQWDADVESCYEYGFIPKWGRSFAVSTPGAFVNKDPEVTKKLFIQAVETAQGYVDKILKENPGQRINVISYSAANGGGFFTADRLPEQNKGRFLSIASGSGLGREIFASSVLEQIKRDVVDLGITDGEAYNSVFKDEKHGLLLPYENCENLGDDTVIAIGKNDLYIPAKFGKEIADKASRANPRIQVVEYPFGHIGTILYMSHLEHLKHMKVVRTVREELAPEDVRKFDDFLRARNIALPAADIPFWVSVSKIVLADAEHMNKSNLVLSQPEKTTIDKIADDFFRAILAESHHKYATYLSFLSSSVRGKIKALQ